MTTRHANILSLVFIGILVALAAWLYPGLPDPMPSHWNAEGEVDGYLPKTWGVLLLPLIAVFLLLMMRIIPVISPKGFRIGPFAGVFNTLQVALVAFASLVGILVLLEAKGFDVRLNQVILVAMGLLFMVLGNYFGKIRKNFFLGIRTPWTLASDEVWSRTHRLGGRLFVAMGTVWVIGAFFPLRVEWLVGAVLLVALVPMIYSFVVYRQVEGLED